LAPDQVSWARSRSLQTGSCNTAVYDGSAAAVALTGMKRGLWKLWTLGALVLSLAAAPGSSARPADCRPVQAVFYESSDWLRLANGLAANASPCAAYYVTIPALAADKTQMVNNRATQVRALGPNFHALAEINYTAWSRWVASTGNSWSQAGQEARRRMDAAGFDISSGDTWAVNEFPSSVRTNGGAARQNVRDLVRGLHDGDGGPAVKGVVYVVGVSQNGLSFPTYKANVESWLQDSAFWNDMASYVSGFYQEAYGDVRNYAVAGVDPPTRAALLNAFLQHPFSLALAGNAPPTVSAARAFLTFAYGPLANASWGWTSAYGWTQVTPDVMADYISAQTYAMRLSGEAHIGFAWNPLNSTNLSAGDYGNGISSVLTRLAGSIHETDAGDPTAACAATGCAATLDGAASAPGWNTFSTWTPTAAVFTTPPVTLQTAVASGPMTLQIETGAVATTLPFDSTLTLTSTSPTGTFSTSATGPFTSTLLMPMPAGTNTATFYFEDTTAGQPTITSNLNGVTATQVESVAAPATAAPPPPPPAAMVNALTYTPVQDRLHVAMTLVDATGQPLRGTIRLAILFAGSQIASAAVRSASDGSVGVTAFPRLRLGCYSVHVQNVTVSGHAWNGVSPTGTYCVRSLPSSVSAIAFGKRNGRLHIGVHIVDPAGHPLHARVALQVLHRGEIFARASGHAARDGSFAVTPRPKLGRGESCFTVRVTAVGASGYRWDKKHATKFGCLKS
jgi:hypothetical protein